MNNLRFFLFSLAFLPFLLFSQNSHQPGFQRNLDVSVIVNADSLTNPWGGGINGAAFYLFDLDLDGNDDLVAFEKNGNRLLTFLRDGNGWSYSPDYQHFFPYLHDWVIFKDYDGDGKKDIFTYGLAGIRVFKNISDQNIDFELVNEQILSYYYTGYSNIFASPDDYLVVEDLDDDGDLDILNFWVLGKYVHYQRNYAVENRFENGYFDYRLEDECWGKFSEGADNNVIELMSYCQDNRSSDQTRHVGSTMTLMDFDNDGVKDLILGDIDYAHVIFLRNGGSTDDALMISQTPAFPNATQAIEMYSMPLVSPVDVDADGLDELLVSPADPSLVKSENIHSVWLYDYDSLAANYVLSNTSFLQNEMIDLGSNAYPILYDWNNDGLLDLFVGNYGYYDSSHYENGFLISYYSSSIAYFQNCGNAQNPVFQLITNDFKGLRSYNLQALYPSFGDIDGDGDTEMICGGSDGKLLLVDGNNITMDYFNIDVGEFATPQLFDIDEDGKLDLLIGNRRGHISYYRNVSTASETEFVLQNQQFGNVDVRDYSLSYYGYATPRFFKMNDEIFLICGSEQGNLFLYDEIRNHLNDDFHLITDNVAELTEGRSYAIKEGIRSSAAIGNLNGDAYPELIVGNYAGGLAYFDGRAEIPVRVPSIMQQNVNIFPNPASEIVNINLSSNDFKSLKVYDICGKLLMEKLIDNQYITLNINDLKSGVYLILLEGEKGFVEQKLIKK